MATKTESKNSRDGRIAEQPDLTDLKSLADSALSKFHDYARANPETAALWCLAIGFFLGWKLRP
jgi:hypothetical protein